MIRIAVLELLPLPQRVLFEELKGHGGMQSGPHWQRGLVHREHRAVQVVHAARGLVPDAQEGEGGGHRQAIEGKVFACSTIHARGYCLATPTQDASNWLPIQTFLSPLQPTGRFIDIPSNKDIFLNLAKGEVQKQSCHPGHTSQSVLGHRIAVQHLFRV